MLSTSPLWWCCRWKTQLRTFSGRRGSFTRTPNWWGRWTTPKSGSTRGNFSKPFTSRYSTPSPTPCVGLTPSSHSSAAQTWNLNCLTPVAKNTSVVAVEETCALFHVSLMFTFYRWPTELAVVVVWFLLSFYSLFCFFPFTEILSTDEQGCFSFLIRLAQVSFFFPALSQMSGWPLG